MLSIQGFECLAGDLSYGQADKTALGNMFCSDSVTFSVFFLNILSRFFEIREAVDENLYQSLYRSILVMSQPISVNGTR